MSREVYTQIALWDLFPQPQKRKSYKQQLMEFVEYRDKMAEQLQTMCRRCVNHEMCEGTGCGPRDDLHKLIYNLRLMPEREEAEQ